MTQQQDKPNLAKGLKYYNPLSIGSLGVVLKTGAWNLTAFKAKPGLAFFTPEGYLSDFGSLLSLKLLIVFILINVSAAVSLGMGHRLVRTEVRGEPSRRISCLVWSDASKFLPEWRWP